ncbi:MAG: hypothetical protein M1591_07225 [Deltaproteobacteria bacterium]|nr:hypothetical protein [Deltaproteobacteria bacterium]
MTNKTHENELDALKAQIANLRQEIAGLSAGAKKAAGVSYEQLHASAGEEGSTRGEEGHSVWSDLFHKFNSSKIQGEKVVSDLAAEVGKYPLVSIMAAFGLGYIIAKLWYQESKHADTNDAP